MVRVLKSEKDVKAEVKRQLGSHGFFWWMPPANSFGRSGIADVNAIRDGVFVAIETKFKGNVPSAMQVGFLSSIDTHSAFAFVVDENNLDSLKAWLEAFDRSTEVVQRGGKPSPEDGSIMLNALAELTKGWRSQVRVRKTGTLVS